MGPKTELLTGVSSDRIGEVVQGYVADGAIALSLERQPDGLWLVQATMGAPPGSSSSSSEVRRQGR